MQSQISFRLLKMKILLIFSIFVSFSASSPQNRAENKNWKLKAGFYGDSRAFNDPITSYRLPNNTKPVRYDIFLKTDVDKKIFDFFGRVKIQVKAVEETDSVTLQYRDINVSKVSLLDISGQILNDNLIFEYLEPKRFEFLKISLPRLMNVDENFILEVTYNGTLSTSQGFYRAYFMNGTDRIDYAVTQFQSTDARHAFPCYDEPGIRAPFGLEIQHDRSYHAYSNMELIDDTSIIGTDYVVSRFQDTPAMPTYLLAFLVAPFEFTSNNNSEITQKIIAKPSSIRNGEAEFAIALTDPILRKFESHLNVNYTLSKLDHAAITQFDAGAMENWGLVTYREFLLLFTPTGYPDYDEDVKRTIITIMAHEDAHQFFGNLVTPLWWTDLWLSEGLATFYEYYVPHLLYPNDNYMISFRNLQMLRCFDIDQLGFLSSVPMSRYVESPLEIEYKFDDISYNKGGVVIRMFQEAYGVDIFTKGLTKYLQKMAFKASIPEDLFSAVQEAIDEDFPSNSMNVAQTMGSWVYQAGYPVIRVSKNGNNFVFRQQRYPTGNGEIYSVPLSFASKVDPDFSRKTAKIWLHSEKMEVSQNSFSLTATDWIIFNVQQTGYFRISYSSELWHLIAIGLRDSVDKIHPLNRQVLMTELNIGYSSLQELQASDILEVLQYLTGETEYEVWEQAEKLLVLLSNSLIGTAVYDDYLKFLDLITKLELKKIGLEFVNGESLETSRFRDILRYYNCLGLGSLCIDHESEKLKLYMENTTNPVPDFCVAFRYASIPIFVDFLNELISNPELENRFSIVRGVSCSMDQMLLMVVTFVVEDEKNILASFERTIIIENLLMSSTTGLEVGFEYLERNIEKISNFQTVLKLVVNDQKYSDRLDIILDEAAAEDFITVERASDIKEAVKANLKWQNEHFEGVRDWFEYKKNPATTTEVPTTTEDDSASGIFSSFIFVVIAFVLVRMFE